MSVLPGWPPARLRVLAFETEDDGPWASIRAVGRIDVVTNPTKGLALGRIQSAHYDPQENAALPFVGKRLEEAVRAPAPADALVVAHPDACAMVPDEVRLGTPWIVALLAAERLWPVLPSRMMRVCWRHGDDSWVARRIPVENQTLFAAGLVLRMLEVASPAELVWLSGNQG